MSDNTVRTHNHVSNRAKSAQAANQKVVFKSVLDSPFRIQWPSVPVNVQNSVLALAIGMLDGVASYHSERIKDSRKRKHTQRVESKRNKRQRIEGVEASETQTHMIDESIHTDIPEVASAATVHDSPSGVEKPAICEHIVVGINQVTRRLEAQIRHERLLIDTLAMKLPEVAPPPFLRTILVCCGDVDPPLLVDHIPHLVACYNSSRPTNIIKLIPLPKGAEAALAQATGLRRAAALAIDATFDVVSNLTTLLGTVPALTAPWLSKAADHRCLIPTHIKQICTSAPKDMKAAKERRAVGKKSAKQRKKNLVPPS